MWHLFCFREPFLFLINSFAQEYWSDLLNWDRCTYSHLSRRVNNHQLLGLILGIQAEGRKETIPTNQPTTDLSSSYVTRFPITFSIKTALEPTLLPRQQEQAFLICCDKSALPDLNSLHAWLEEMDGVLGTGLSLLSYRAVWRYRWVWNDTLSLKTNGRGASRRNKWWVILPGALHMSVLHESFIAALTGSRRLGKTVPRWKTRVYPSNIALPQKNRSSAGSLAAEER